MSDAAPLRRTRFQRVFYRYSWWIVLAVFRLLYRFRREGARHVPDTGAALLVSNHVSHYDPPIIGLGCDRRPFHPIARESLFRNPLFGWLIRTLGA
ncbi:MAG: 1-acyl-sn-glycerol-3-phosphate acyltransferase, partial [Phycisphaerales bacterium]